MRKKTKVVSLVSILAIAGILLLTMSPVQTLPTNFQITSDENQNGTYIDVGGMLGNMTRHMFRWMHNQTCNGSCDQMNQHRHGYHNHNGFMNGTHPGVPGHHNGTCPYDNATQMP